MTGILTVWKEEAPWRFRRVGAFTNLKSSPKWLASALVISCHQVLGTFWSFQQTSELAKSIPLIVRCGLSFDTHSPFISFSAVPLVQEENRPKVKTQNKTPFIIRISWVWSIPKKTERATRPQSPPEVASDATLSSRWVSSCAFSCRPGAGNEEFHPWPHREQIYELARNLWLTQPAKIPTFRLMFRIIVLNDIKVGFSAFQKPLDLLPSCCPAAFDPRILGAVGWGCQFFKLGMPAVGRRKIWKSPAKRGGTNRQKIRWFK